MGSNGTGSERQGVQFEIEWPFVHLLYVSVSECPELFSYISKHYHKVVHKTLKPWNGINFEGVEPLLEIDLLEMGQFDMCDLTNPSVSPSTTHTYVCMLPYTYTMNSQ